MTGDRRTVGDRVVAGMAALYVLAIVAPLPAERALVAGGALAGLAVLLWRAATPYRIASIGFLAAGAAVVLATPATLGEAWLGFGELMDVTVLLVVIPVLAVPFSLRAYGADIGALLARRFRHARPRYAVYTGASALLAAMVSIGAAPLVHASVPFHRDSPLREARGLTRGVVLGVMWSPMGGFFTMVLTRSGAPPAPMMLLCLCTAVIAWLADAATLRPGATAGPDLGDHPTRPGAGSGAATLAGAILVYSGLLIGLHELTGISVIEAVILVAVPYVLLWACCLREPLRAARRIRATLWREVRAISSQGSALLSIGFFATALLDAGVDAHLAGWLDLLGLPGAAVLVLLGAVPLVFAPLGLHPFIVVVLVMGVVDPATLGVPPEALGLALLGGAVGSLAVSHFSTIVNVTAGLTGLSTARISLLNLRFSVLLWLLAGAIAAAVVILG